MWDYRWLPSFFIFLSYYLLAADVSPTPSAFQRLCFEEGQHGELILKHTRPGRVELDEWNRMSGTGRVEPSPGRETRAVECDLTCWGETVGVNGLAKSKDRGDSSLIWTLDNLEPWRDYRSGLNDDVQLWQMAVGSRWQTAAVMNAC